MPKLQIFRNSSLKWESITSKKFRDHVRDSRPPVSRAVPSHKQDHTVVLLLSIDSGTGTVKFMGLFMHLESGKSVDEVFFD